MSGLKIQILGNNLCVVPKSFSGFPRARTARPYGQKRFLHAVGTARARCPFREFLSDFAGRRGYGFAIALLSLCDISPKKGIFADPYAGCAELSFCATVKNLTQKKACLQKPVYKLQYQTLGNLPFII